jgi:cytochrome b
LVWGLIGTRHARFASFVRGPAAVISYFKAMLKGQPEHHVGHNPAGALAIIFLLLMSAVTVFSGWAVYSQSAGKAFGELHEGAANLMLAVVFLHIAAVALTSWLHRENLVRAMVTGHKQGAANQGVRRSWRVLGLVLLLAVLGFWWQQWQAAPMLGKAAGTEQSKNHGARAQGDDD